ncbi:MAG: RICIN domain-containing protein [Clostridia bacterium]|nr:RICIN domain-containing protein [Clostridia bacterium]
MSSASYCGNNWFNNNNYRGQCTWYAWGRANEKLGISFPYLGNAKDWPYHAGSYQVDSTPSANSIAVWTQSAFGYTDDATGQWVVTGHVAYVEKYENNTIYITESNRVYLTYTEGNLNLSTSKFTYTYGSSGIVNNAYKPTYYIHLQPTDTTPPTFSNVQVTNKTADGYTVTCTVSDNVGVTRVQFPTWTAANGQDDLVWHTGTISGSTASFRVLKSAHKNEGGEYWTDIYAWDAAGNEASYKTVKVNMSTYTVSYNANGGSGAPGSQTKLHDVTLKLSSTKPTRGTYNFTGWNTKANGSGTSYAPGANYTANASVTLYAQWSPPKVSVSEGVYVIHNVRDMSKVLDIQGNSTARGANIQLYDDLLNQAQKFRVVKSGSYYCIQSLHSGMWLDIANPYNEDGCNIQLWDTNTSNEQQWIFEDAGNGNVYIHSRYGKYLDTKDGKTDNNTNIQTYHFDGTTSQQWRLQRVSPNERVEIPEGEYVFHCVRNPDKVLDIGNNSTASGAKIQLYDNLYNQVQKFRVVKSGKYYNIQSAHSGMWLDVKSPYYEQGCQIQLYNTNTRTEEKWAFEDAGDGNVYIRNGYDMYLDTGGPTDNGTNIQTWNYDSSTSQQWKLVRVSNQPALTIEEGIYEFHNACDTSKVMAIKDSSTANHATMELDTDTDATEQKFRVVKLGTFSSLKVPYYSIQSLHSGKWVDIHYPKLGTKDLTIQMYSENTRPEEKWIFEDAGNGNVVIRNLFDVYLDTSGDKADNGTALVTDTYTGTTSQQWKLVKTSPFERLDIPDGIYTIHSAADPTKVMDIQDNSTANRANIQLGDDCNNNVQRFIFTKHTDETTNSDYYLIRSAYSDHWLDTKFAAAGSTIQLFNENTRKDERWILEDAGNGNVLIRSPYETYIDTEGGSTESGTNIQTSVFNDSSSMQWTLQKVNTVTFDVNYDSVNPNLFAVSADSVTKDGISYRYSASDDTVILDGTLSASGADLSVMPFKAEAGTYTVTIEQTSGSVDASGACFVLELKGTEALGTRADYNFKGSGTTTWSISAEDAAKIYCIKLWQWRKDSSSTLTAANAAFRIKIEKASSATPFSPTAQAVTYSSTYGTLPSPTRTGYVFDGWYTSASDGTKIAANSRVDTTENQTLYAKWEKVFVIGDADGDGDIGLKDVVQISRYLAGGWDVTIDEAAADVNKDGVVNLKDAVLLRRYLAGGWDVVLK